MARKEKTIHYIYKTTCMVTNRYYIGMHSTSRLDDGYMGSGKRLRYSIRKHGKENHEKEILEFFETREELIKREIEIVTSLLIKEPNCMNLVIGGGGFMLDDYHYYCSKKGNEKLNDLLKNDPIFKENWLRKMKLGVQKAMDNGKMKTWKDNYDWNGKTHSNETKEKISLVMNGMGTGETNSQYNTCWISNENEVKKEELEKYLNDGWVKGKFYNIFEIIKYYKDVKSYGKTAKYFNIPKRTIIDNIKSFQNKMEGTVKVANTA